MEGPRGKNLGLGRREHAGGDAESAYMSRKHYTSVNMYGCGLWEYGTNIGIFEGMWRMRETVNGERSCTCEILERSREGYIGVHNAVFSSELPTRSRVVYWDAYATVRNAQFYEDGEFFC